MKNNWYISLFILALAIAGIGLDQSSIANQEVVLKFTNLEVSETESQEVINYIKGQLEEANVENIQILKPEQGVLKIKYHSDLDVARIKEIFSKGNDFALEKSNNKSSTKFPLENEGDVSSFHLDVFEIQLDKDFVGTPGTVVEGKSEIVRFFAPDGLSILGNLEDKDTEIAQVAYNTSFCKTLGIEIGFCRIPQVRAGPRIV